MPFEVGLLERLVEQGWFSGLNREVGVAEGGRVLHGGDEHERRHVERQVEGGQVEPAEHVPETRGQVHAETRPRVSQKIEFHCKCNMFVSKQVVLSAFVFVSLTTVLLIWATQ